MRKFVLILFLVVFLMGCQTGELPPEPGDFSGPLGKAVHIYEGYSPPNDVFDNNKMIFNLEQNVINIDVDEDNFTLNLEVSHDASFIYKYGYYYSKKGWQKYLFDSEPYKESNWIKDHAKKELNLQVDDFNAGENYIVAYSCKRHDGKWKCGCTTVNGPCNKWMLQSYLLFVTDLPPEPSVPDDVYVGDLWISPSNGLYKGGSKVSLSAYLSTKQDVSAQFENGDFKVTNVDSEEVYYIIPSEGSGMECSSCSGEYCNYYYCYGRYYADFEFSEGGNYIIEFETNLDNLYQNNGSFEINSTYFNRYLIEEDIGVLGYLSSSGMSYLERGWQVGARYSSYDANVWAYAIYGKNFMEELQGFIEHSNPELVEIDGNYIYRLEEIYYSPYYDEKSSEIMSVWISGGVGMVIHGYGADTKDYDALIQAYLRKVPSDLKNGTQILPNRCTFPAGLDCIDIGYEQNGDLLVNFAVKNNLGYSLSLADVNVLTNSGYFVCEAPDFPVDDIEYGDTIEFSMVCSGDLESDRLRADIYLYYTNLETGLEHKSRGEIYLNIDQNEAKCTDSDGGKKYYVKGNVTNIVKGDETHYQDKCVTPCHHQDGTNFYAEKGGVFYCYNNFESDWCAGENCSIAESYCGQEWNFSIAHCPNGCEDGACIEEQEITCTDSDGGINYYVKGYLDNGLGETFEDYCNCILDYCDVVVDFYCDESSPTGAIQKHFTCPNGCEDGACIEEKCTTDADCSDIICTMMIGSDTPRCNVTSGSCYCGGKADVIGSLESK
ncbi:MAG: hypothetical protein KAK00_06105 [Nanoarchaeota archaeon]|nr:hypothetical protein [Nanoarchaeota archaeon]